MDSSLLLPGTIKICSLREVAHAEYVVAAGANLFGLVFADARRRVDAKTAQLIVGEVHALEGNSRTRSVGVFVDQSSDEVNRIADAVGLDLVQLHGSESPEFARSIERPMIRAFRSQPGMLVSTIHEHLAQMPSDRLVAALVDGFHAGQPGGSGAVADWSLASGIASKHPVILAGGLTPETVATAIRSVRPLGVDVSSGVEVDGQKNRDRMINFVAEARAAFAELRQSAMSI